METSLPQAQREVHVFRKSLPLRIRLDQIIRALGKTEGLACLDAGLDNGMMSHYLRRRGGEWYTVVSSESLAASVRTVIPENVYVMDGNSLPFRKKVFDAVIVADVLERFEPHESFIEECHRILKPDGHLIVIAANRKTVTMIRLVRRLLGNPRARRGLIYEGQTESVLFSILKHGFDVFSLHTFIRFFVELVDTCVESVANRMAAKGRSDAAIMRFYSMAGILFVVAAQLDMLLLFTRGHYLIAHAKRRAWRPRKTPVLSDGRTISEAVLSRAPK